MTGTAASGIDGEYLARFFRDREIGEFAIVPSSAIAAPPGRRPADLFPACRTMILFGKVMGDELFSGSAAETAPRIAAFRQELADLSGELAGVLEKSGAGAVAVTSVVVRDGRLKGGLSLRHCAADAGLGEIGDNGLLISPLSGIRLGLGVVLTDREIPGAAARARPPQLCTHCRLCIKACPADAFRDGGIDPFRCRNIAGALPGPFVTLFRRFMQIRSLEPVLSGIATRIASRSAARCSACLTACPFFKKTRQ